MEYAHEYYMGIAIEQAQEAKLKGDWPFGAVVVQNEKVIGKGYAKDKTVGDVTEHAEVEALRAASREFKSNNLENCTIYCTNEPCLMCAASIFQAKIAHVVIGASRDDLFHLLRPRKLKIEDLAYDSGLKIKLEWGVLKDKVLALFADIKKG